MIRKTINSIYLISLSNLRFVVTQLRNRLAKELYVSNRLTKTQVTKIGLLNLYKGKRPDYKVIDGHFDQAVLELYKEMIPEGSTVIDVGANVGFHSVLLSKIVGRHGSVLAIEPVDYNLKKLNTNIYLNGCVNVKLVKCLVGSKKRNSVKLFQVTEDQSRLDNSSVLENLNIKKLQAEGGVEEVEVTQTTLDYIYSKIQKPIKLIKVDVEGYELEVLKGAKKTISESRPVIIVEINPKRLRDLNIQLVHFSDELCQHYDLYEIINPNIYEQSISLEPIPNFETKERAGDVLCIPKACLTSLD